MAGVSQKLISAEEFALLTPPADGSRQELYRGEVLTMPPPGFRQGVRQVRVTTLLDHFVQPRKLGRITVESGVITERGPDTVRGPDVAYWSAERLPLDLEPEGYPEAAPDLCVEVLSPGKAMAVLRQKILEYFLRGVRLVWIIDPEDRIVMVYRSPDEGRVYHENATLSGEDVLPGFSCKVADIFA